MRKHSLVSNQSTLFLRATLQAAIFLCRSQSWPCCVALEFLTQSFRPTQSTVSIEKDSSLLSCFQWMKKFFHKHLCSLPSPASSAKEGVPTIRFSLLQLHVMRFSADCRALRWLLQKLTAWETIPFLCFIDYSRPEAKQKCISWKNLCTASTIWTSKFRGSTSIGERLTI